MQGRPCVWLATGFENLGDKVARFVHYSLLDICSTYLFRLDYLRERDKLQASKIYQHHVKFASYI